MRNMLKVIAFAAILPTASFAPQSRQISLDDLIPKDQQQKTGIYKLTGEEKEVLRQHILALLTAACAQTNSGTQSPRISEPSPKQPATSSKTYTVGGGHWVRKNIDHGAYILLEDGSLWEVDHLDKIDAALWLSLSNITVVESSSGSPGYDYLLINTDDGEKAHAKYIGKQ